MDKYLKPEKFSVSSDSPTAGKEFNHWLATFENFLAASPEPLEDADKLKVIANFLSFNVYELISECSTYQLAVETLTKTYVKTKGEIFARHLLAIRKQQSGESVDQYVQTLKLMSKDCNFKAVSAEEHKNQYIRDAFINGLLSPHIRQRLLEEKTLSFDDAHQRALALEMAQKQAEGYHTQSTVDYSCAGTSTISTVDNESETVVSKNSDDVCAGVRPRIDGKSCFFCGFNRHSRSACPAIDSNCANCGIKGHYARVCRKLKKAEHKRADPNKSKNVTASILASINEGFLPQLSKAVTEGAVNGIPCQCLVDTGSSGSFVGLNFANKHNFKIIPNEGRVSMASTSLWTKVEGYIVVKLEIAEHTYTNCKLTVLKKLCSDVLIGHDILKKHSNILLSFGGDKDPLTICSSLAKVEPPRLFNHLTADCHPIATKSRRYCDADTKFIESEVKRMLNEGVIEPSNSPWRAQVLVIENNNHKKRLVIDYSQTINRFTLLDAYPLPNVDELVRKVANFKHFSAVDLKNAYHQIPICQEDKKFTAFQAGGKLFQFTRIPFGVTNGVACFQRVIDQIILDEQLTGVYAYLDDITVCGKDKIDHDRNLNKLMMALEKLGIEVNKQKSKFDLTCINLLGHLVSYNSIKPDPSRLAPLLNMPLPRDAASLKRALGFFAHYSKWIPRFSDKIRKLTDCHSFPLSSQAAVDFGNIKKEIANSVVTTVDESSPLVVETDASNVALAATLSQGGRPVAFFSRSLNKSEKGHPSIEKEAAAIVESLRNWKAFLLGKHFHLITDQEALSFIFDKKHASKIKNEKITRWRLELAPFSYDITYRPGKENIKADALSRICNAANITELYELHQSLCHPGITRMFHWLRSKNLPYSLDDVRKMTAKCAICAEVKPRFLKSSGVLVKATSPFERLNIDFKGPLPSKSRNFYLLTIIDEFSRFPFAYACHDISAATVVNCLKNLFCMFGTPAYIHSDRGASFMSEELKSFLHANGVATSRTTPYNPRGNGQIERLNGTLWKTIMLALKTRKMRTQDWEDVLQEALHSIRSLLNTATNCTPHERFFNHQRRTANGVTLPSWLTPGPVLAKRNVRSSKYEDLVDEVELLEANPQYALIRRKDGSESTVSLRQLAPIGAKVSSNNEHPSNNGLDCEPPSTGNQLEAETIKLEAEKLSDDHYPVMEILTADEKPTLPEETHRSRPQRNIKLPSHFEDYVLMK